MRILITGGCGFVGSNLAHAFLQDGKEVTVYDNMSRKGAEFNRQWLEENHKSGLDFINADIRDFEKINQAAKDKDTIFHTAAQVTMTDSVKDPRTDFEINALGTFNALEAARLSNMNPVFIYTSTNKVYGDGANFIPLREGETRWEFADPKFANGIPETFPTDFDKHGPYGNSKYTADLYTRDYTHVFGLQGVVFRQSSVFGTRQFGYFDQGWISHIVNSSIFNWPIQIDGDGKQVRDVLFMEDLIGAFKLAIKHIGNTKGKAYNIGGGPKNTISLIELIRMLEEMNGKKLTLRYADWRPADQKVYISDISKAKRDFGWEPKTSVKEGVTRLNNWVKENMHLFKNISNL